MYETSSTLRRPARSLQLLWRYLSAHRLQDLLQTSELFFTNLPAFDDRLEGALTDRTREHLATWFQNQNKSSRLQAYEEVAHYQEHQRAFYVNCWHMNDHESYLMWKAYADRGFAIQTTFERVQASFDPFVGIVTGGVVDYVNFERDLTPVGNVFNHVATKDIPYRDEREFRLVVWGVDPRNQELAKVPDGIRVAVNVGMLVHSIVASPFESTIDPELEALIVKHRLLFDSSKVTVRGQH